MLFVVYIKMAASMTSARVAVLLEQSKHINLFRNLSLCCVRCHPVSSQGKHDEVRIPNRIHRSPTAILEAIASTIEKDPLGPSHKYVDDPYLLPGNNLEKRSFSLSRASGKKAAKWFLQRFQRDFNRDIAVPSVKHFMPTKDTFRIMRDNPDETGLNQMITTNNISGAWELYQKLKESGTSLSAETYVSLLDLFCYSNGEEIENLETEEKWFWREIGQEQSMKLKNRWKEDGYAEKLFADIPTKDAAVYRSMIRGLCKWFHVDKAYDMYSEMIKNKMPIDLATYNSLLEIAPYTQDENEKRLELIMKILTEMQTSGVKPNLKTFNTVLRGISRMGRWRYVHNIALQVINEMKACGIEPSLGSWAYILMTFYSNDGSQSDIIYEIMDAIEDKDHVTRDESDGEFFRIAMIKCAVNLKDVDLAYRLDKLVNYKRNSLIFTDGYKESIYYVMFFRLLCNYEMLDDVMKVYDRCVPHIWTPGFNIMSELIKCIELHDGYKYIPQIWSDLLLFDYINREDLLEPTLAMIAKQKQNEQLQGEFMSMANTVKSKIEIGEAAKAAGYNVRTMAITGPMIGYLIQSCLNSDDIDMAMYFFNHYAKKTANLAGLPSELSLQTLAERCILEKDFVNTLRVLTVISDLAYSVVPDLANKAKAELELSDAERQQLSMLV